jgi:hypothetical protein
MTALADFLFPAHAGRSTVEIIAWWEARRLPYNLLVGGAGLLSLVLTSLLAALPPFGGDVPFMWAPIVAFGIMANVCYLIGPVLDVCITRMWKGEVLPTGPALYRMGLTFSVGLALFPTLIMLIAWIVRIVSAAL